MLETALVKIVAFCSRKPWPVLILALVVTLLSARYVGVHFAINTDIGKLISEKLDWRQNQIAYEKTFSTDKGTIVAVLDGPSPEVTEDAARRLATALLQAKTYINDVRLLTSDDFFR